MAKKKLVKGLWSKSEVALLRKLFPSNPTAKVAARLGRSLDMVKKKASSALSLLKIWMDISDNSLWL